MMRAHRLFALLIAAALGPAVLSAQTGTTVTPVSGTVEVRAPGGSFTTVDTTRAVPAGATVRTGADGLALLRMPDGSEAVLHPGSTVEVAADDAGLSILLGKVLLRIRHLFQSGQERAYRTPTTVAAVRGTEFGLAVDASGATRVFVFDGLVAISNTQLPDSVVAVRAGFMSDVAPGRPPATPRTFATGEWDGVGGGDALERGEDRLVESTQAAVSARYLAFADPDIDALGNPAYLTEGPASRMTSLFAAWGYSGTSSVSEAGAATAAGKGATTKVEESRGGEALTQHLAVAPVGGLRLGAYVQADGGTDRGIRDVRLPMATTATRMFQDQKWRMAEGRLLVSGGEGAWGWGVAGGYHRSGSDLDERPVSSTAALAHTDGETTVTTTHVGLLHRGTGGTTLGLGYRYLRSDERLTGATTNERFIGRTHTAELLARGLRGGTLWGGWLQLERATVHETLDGAAGRVYAETGSVWSVKSGVGLGFQPASGVVLGADAAVGVAPEKAVQHRPDGTRPESEDDLRVSASLHVGGQVTLAGPWRLDVSVLHGFERLARTFVVEPDLPSPRTIGDARVTYGTQARIGLLYVGGRLAAGYLVRAAPEPGRPPLHTLLAVARVF